MLPPTERGDAPQTNAEPQGDRAKSCPMESSDRNLERALSVPTTTALKAAEKTAIAEGNRGCDSPPPLRAERIDLDQHVVEARPDRGSNKCFHAPVTSLLPSKRRPPRPARRQGHVDRPAPPVGPHHLQQALADHLTIWLKPTVFLAALALEP